MLFSQNASKIIISLLLYCFVARLRDLVYAEMPDRFCPKNSSDPYNSKFLSNLDNLLNSLSSHASTSNFHKTSIGNDSDRLYGLYMCLSYSENADCNNCVTSAARDIKKFCHNASEAVVWEEICQLRYSDKEFFGDFDTVGNIGEHNPMNISEPEQFNSAVKSILGDLKKKAAIDPLPNKYAFGNRRFEEAEIFAAVQCTGDLSPDDCKACLDVAIANVSTCRYFFRGARILSKSCYLRYELYDFTGPAENVVPKKSRKLNIEMTIILAVSSFVAVLLFGSFVYCLMVNILSKGGRNDRELPLHDLAYPIGINFRQHHMQENDAQNTVELPYIDLSSIIEATNNFAESNKLGQGGFGPVYKGKLNDGRERAVKRLSSYSEQGSEEFTNEVLLIMKLQHKNLVRLLGFCINEEEKLLVYEYMPNGSLDVLLFGEAKRAQLDWSSRLSIISGIAKGMLYLHEDSRLRIIHRDLKASNVLLDGHMNPKISDFGMARILVGTEGEAIACRLVGTYGYMAPEYAMEGYYSIKSDVFSFGVLLLEIITGKRSAGFQQSKCAPSLIAYAWQLWNNGKALELMDPLLEDSCCPDEFVKCVYIGLLCVQECAHDRPTMSSVVVMLNSGSETLRQPERPAFSWGTSDHDYDEINVDSLSINSVEINVDSLSINSVNVSSVSHQLEN